MEEGGEEAGGRLLHEMRQGEKREGRGKEPKVKGRQRSDGVRGG